MKIALRRIYLPTFHRTCVVLFPGSTRPGIRFPREGKENERGKEKKEKSFPVGRFAGGSFRVTLYRLLDIRYIRFDTGQRNRVRCSANTRTRIYHGKFFPERERFVVWIFSCLPVFMVRGMKEGHFIPLAPCKALEPRCRQKSIHAQGMKAQTYNLLLFSFQLFARSYSLYSSLFQHKYNQNNSINTKK
ncbi:MAG: hypothetical protein LUD68_04210 [Rikenellaceae bacterium]|nr:hypothetical protein [Rikenellaceae bacterium]